MRLEAFRKEFPLLETFSYLDSASNSLVPKRVLLAVNEFYEQCGGVSNRGLHKITVKASQEVKNARATVADFLNAEDPKEIIFTQNTASATSMVAYGLPLKENCKIVTTKLAHHSSLLPWMRAANKRRVMLSFLGLTPEGLLDEETATEIITGGDCKVLVITLTPMVHGHITPLNKLIKLAKEVEALIFIDVTRATGHIPLNVHDLQCDFLVFAGNVGLFAPQGTGILYANQEVLKDLEPLFVGSGTVSKVTPTGCEFVETPERFEGGVLNVGGIVGLNKALEIIKELGLETIRDYEKSLTKRLLDDLSKIEKVKIYGSKDVEKRIGIVGFNVERFNPHDIALFLDEFANIGVRSGKMCSHLLVESLGKKEREEGIVQASLHCYNNLDDIEKLVSTIKMMIEELSKN
ncbi:MAG: aminotransferase class V-fold PLP-dependent enzyme [Candidatus Hodarchaeota archaeon]